MNRTLRQGWVVFPDIFLVTQSKVVWFRVLLLYLRFEQHHLRHRWYFLVRSLVIQELPPHLQRLPNLLHRHRRSHAHRASIARYATNAIETGRFPVPIVNDFNNRTVNGRHLSWSNPPMLVAPKVHKITDSYRRRFP